MMKKCAVMIVLLCLAKTVAAYDMAVVVNGVAVGQGRIYVGLFNDSAEFPDGRQAAGHFLEGDRESVRVIFTDLPEGAVAIAVFQDKNLNEKLDTNFLGIPTERYGFSGKQSFGKPSFDDARVMVASENQRIVVNMD